MRRHQKLNYLLQRESFELNCKILPAAFCFRCPDPILRSTRSKQKLFSIHMLINKWPTIAGYKIVWNKLPPDLIRLIRKFKTDLIFSMAILFTVCNVHDQRVKNDVRIRNLQINNLHGHCTSKGVTRFVFFFLFLRSPTVNYYKVNACGMNTSGNKQKKVKVLNSFTYPYKLWPYNQMCVVCAVDLMIPATITFRSFQHAV